MAKVEQHPIYRVPTAADARALAAARGISDLEALELLFRTRAERIANERHDPLRFGYEPSIWRVADAVLGLDWAIPDVFGKDYGPRMRKRLGLSRPVSVLMINGGQRGGKTTYMIKRSMQCLMRFDQTMLWAFHTDAGMSRTYHQAVFWQFMPPELRREIKTQTTYISFKLKSGFADGTEFILPNLSRCEFRTYAMDKNKIEGGNLGEPKQRGGKQDEHGLFAWRCLGFMADEHVPADWIETLGFRIAEREACGVVGFTPTNGYSEAVKLFRDGASVLRERTAYLLPKDGGEVDPRLYEREDCDAWLEAEAEAAEVRMFERVPRVMRCADPRRAVVFFHSSDNAYGNPKEVYGTVAAKDRKMKLERFYGLAEKQIGGQFPLFDPKVHVIRHELIPKKGTYYLIVDPCDGRNFFMQWVLSCPDGKDYVVAEWPSCVDPVPGHGVLGEWAVTSGDSKLLDGRRGPAQNGLGWGLAQYKAEIARVEGWECYRDGASVEEIVKWDQHGPARMKVFRRFLDSRFGNTNSLNADGVRSLFDEFADNGLDFEETSTGSRVEIETGVRLINDALYYNAERKVVEVLNEPRLRVSDRCQNTIFALQVWTGADGAKSATKDPVDCLRYYYLKECQYVSESSLGGVAGGGCY